MNEYLEITIPGEPIAQPRHRVMFKMRRIYDPLSNVKKKFTLDDCIISFSKNKQFFNDKPMAVEFQFYCGRPKSHFKKSVKKDVDNSIKKNFLILDKITKPDLSNYVKFYEDLLQIVNFPGTETKIIKNDNLIINLQAAKFYTLQDQKPETYIKLINI